MHTVKKYSFNIPSCWVSQLNRKAAERTLATGEYCSASRLIRDTIQSGLELTVVDAKENLN